MKKQKLKHLFSKKRKRIKLSTPPKRQIRLYRRRVKDAKLAVLGLKRTVPRIRRRRLTLSREVVGVSKIGFYFGIFINFLINEPI